MLIKIKDFLDRKEVEDSILALILILAMSVSFLLGRLSNNSKNAIIIEGSEYVSDAKVQPSALTIENAENKSKELGTGSIVASSRGSKYYFVWCSGAKTLSETNKVYFESEESAQSAGYTLSTTCKK